MLSLDQGVIPRWNQRLREKSKTFKVWTNNNFVLKINQALLFASSVLKQKKFYTEHLFFE